MRVFRTLLIGSLVGEAILYFIPSRNFLVTLTALAVGCFVATLQNSIPGTKVGVSRLQSTEGLIASCLNLLTLVQFTRTSHDFPRLTLSMLEAEDNAAWLRIASSAMFADDKEVHFGMLYHVLLSGLNGAQVVASNLVGINTSSIATPVNSVNALYLFLLIAFPWLAFLASSPIPSSTRGNLLRIAALTFVNVIVLGALSEAYRIGHLSAALTIFCTSIAIISFFAQDATSRSEIARASILICSTLMLWHPLRPVAVALLLTLGLINVDGSKFKSPLVKVRWEAFHWKACAPNAVIWLSIIVIGTSTILTGIFGMIAGMVRDLPLVGNWNLWQSTRGSYLDQLLSAPGGTVSIGELLIIELVGVTALVSASAAFATQRYRSHGALGLVLTGYLTIVLALDALDDGVRSYGALKMTWIYAPLLVCLVLSWTQLPILRTQNGVSNRSAFVAFMIIVAGTYAVEDPSRLYLHLAAPEVKEVRSQGDSINLISNGDSKWDRSTKIEALRPDGRTLACVQLSQRYEVEQDFEAYSCSRRIYSVTLTANSPDEKISTAFMWRSLGRLSHSEMMAMLAENTDASSLSKDLIILEEDYSFSNVISLSTFLSGTTDGP